MLLPPSSTTQTSAKLADKIDFLERVGSSYGYANSKRGFIDDWRSSEFPTLLRPLKLPQRFFRQQKPYSEQTREERHCDNFSEPEVYLDYAGSAIPTRTLLSHISQSEQILANPHSMGGGLASDRTLKLMQLAKDRVMQHFGIQHEIFGVDELDKNGVNEEHDISCTMPCPGYQLSFTSGATESLRLIAERFPWGHAKITANQSSHMRLGNANNGALPIKSIQAQSILLYPRNVHTSVIGMRNIAMQRGAQFQCVLVDELLGATCDWFQNLIKGAMSYEHREVEVHHAENKDEEKKEEQHSSAAFQVDDFRVQIESADAIKDSTSCKTVWMHHLLVLPLECNFGGDRFDWSRTSAMARKCSFSSFVHCSSAHHPQSTTIRFRHKWHILLDTTKAAATSPVNLRTLAAGGPDFAVISLYKMLGSPTGLGALFVRKNLRKRRNEVDHIDEHDKTRESPVIEASCITKQQSMMSEHLLSGRIVLERNLPSRQFFGGGSVDLVMPEKDVMVPQNTSRAASVTLESDEDENIDLGVMVHGTEHFRGIANLTHGFQELDDLGGMEAVSARLLHS
jgi:molybdenum cofactor sulfurtransferase